MANPSRPLPTGWRRVRFGDMAESITDRVDIPAESGVERYVGLEHLDPETLKIRRWGVPTDVEATKLRFKSGDIIFGRRRAYQRKVAVADFEGICSAHALVLRAREDVVLKELLPFFMQGETFFERALAISVGSLSPIINWKTLAQQEFALPPLDEQRRIAEILWAADEVWTRSEECIVQTIALRSALIEHWLENGSSRDKWPQVKLGDLLTASPRSGHSPVSSGRDTGHYVLILSALSGTGYRRGHLKPVELIPQVEATKLSKGDLLISRSNTLDLVGLIGIFDEERNDVSFPDTMMLLSVDEHRIEKRFLEQVLLSRRGRSQIRRIAAGTSGSMKKINRQGLSSVIIPLPPFAIQREIIDQFNSCAKALQAAECKYESNTEIRRALLNQLLAG